jgi:hypothetical protein
MRVVIELRNLHLGLLVSLVPSLFAAFSASPSFQLQSYGINGAASNTSTSATYQLQSSTGQIENVKTASPTYAANPGSIQAQQASVPPAPTVSNGSNTYYNKLLIIINNTGNLATDTTFAVASSTDGFATTQYVQADGTLGVTPLFQTYLQWGAGGGSFMTALKPSTAYQVKVSAMQGVFTQSAYGPSASSSTAGVSISFSVSPNSQTLPNLFGGTIVSGGALTASFATNASFGGNVYVSDSNAGLVSTSRGTLISSVTADLTATGHGYGLRGASATQVSGGPLALVSPYNGIVNNIGALQLAPQILFGTAAPVVGGNVSATIQAKASSTDTAASDYQDVVSFIAAASF